MLPWLQKVTDKTSPGTEFNDHTALRHEILLQQKIKSSLLNKFIL